MGHWGPSLALNSTNINMSALRQFGMVMLQLESLFSNFEIRGRTQLSAMNTTKLLSARKTL